MTFEEVWNELKSKDTTGTFAKAEELSLVSIEAIEYAFNSGYAEAKKEFERPQAAWINTSPYDDTGECSLCCYLSKKYYNFCPNCGAAMRRGNEE